MPKEKYDPEKTPAATPNAKKSSGEWKLNLDGAKCGRFGCGHRRDQHKTHDGGSHRWECDVLGCACAEFVIGGDPPSLPDFADLADTPKTDPPKK